MKSDSCEESSVPRMLGTRKKKENKLRTDTIHEESESETLIRNSLIHLDDNGVLSHPFGSKEIAD